MKVALFVPCYIDQLQPEVGLATLGVLESHGVEVEFPTAQTCCGQPMANAGAIDHARDSAKRFASVFSGYDYVVAPSGSCVAMVREHYRGLLCVSEHEDLSSRTFELCEFLFDVLGVRTIDRAFPHRVGLHPSCHGLRELRVGPTSERGGQDPQRVDKIRTLLSSLAGIELVAPTRPDECCGFGGSFAVDQPEISCRMGENRVADHETAGAEVITSIDGSCLLHLSGIARRVAASAKRAPIPTMHIAEILAGRPLRVASS